MRKHKQGSLISVIVLLIVAAIAGFLFFSMIKDQIFFKSVKQVERVEKLNVTLDQAAKKTN